MSDGPGHFLVQKGDDKPARFEDEGAWSKILDTAGLAEKNLPEVEIEGATGDNDLTVTAGEDLWDLQFSSANNSIYFGPAPEEWKNELRNNAWLGDEFGSAVMILSVPSPAIPDDIFSKRIPLRKGSDGDPTSVWKAFEISDKNKQLNSFIEQFERGSFLKVKLHTSSSPRPNSNGLWCTTTPEFYAVTVRLNFIFTAEGAISDIENSPIGRAISWVNAKLGININLDKIKSTFSSLPPVFITCSKKTSYSVKDEPTASEPEWTFSIQFAIFNFDFAIDFSAKDTTFYLRPTKSLTDIFGDISEALGSPSGVDNGDMPSTNDDTFSRLIGDHLLLWYIHLDKEIPEAGGEPTPEPTPEAAHQTDPGSSIEDHLEDHVGNAIEQPSRHTAATETGGQNAAEPSIEPATDHSPDHIGTSGSSGEHLNEPIHEPAEAHSATDIARAPSSLSWGIGILAVWNVGPKVPLIIALTYESGKKLFTGKLVLGNDALLIDQRDADFDFRVALPGELLKTVDIDIAHIDDTISLWDVFTDSGEPPEAVKRIPFNLAGAEVTFQSEDLSQADPPKPGSKSKTVTFFMSIAGDSTKPVTPAEEPPSGFVWSQITVLASQMVEKKGTGTAAVSKKNTSLQIFSTMELKSSSPEIPSAILDVDLSYSNVDGGTDWLLSGTIHDMSVALLAEQFFDEDCSSGAMEVLGGLNLKALELVYTYSSGKASSFIITAILVLGELELDLSYQYVAAVKARPGAPATSPRKTAAQLHWEDKPPASAEMKPLEPGPTKSWVFEAFLRVGSQDSTVGSIANSIVKGKGDDLPEFIRDIKVAAEGDPLNAPVKLIYEGSDKDGSVLAVWVNIGAFNLTFVQSRAATSSPLQKPIVKQILRISADQIPMLDKVPLIKELPQPFEHLIYLWVDEGKKPVTPNLNPTVKQGLTRDIFEKNDYSINKVLEKVSIPKIEYKETKKAQGDNDLVLQAGHHFMIIANKKVVLDHVFEPGKSKPVTTPGPPGGRVVNTGTIRAVNMNPPAPERGTGSREDTKAPVEAPATKGDVNTTAGPLSITAFSLQYKNNAIFVGVDATLVLGPLTFSVIGFTIEIDLKGAKLNELAALIKDHITISIHGLAVGVDKPPLSLKGVFIHDITVDPASQESIESYRGGIAVGFKAWKVLAVGEYAIVTNLATPGEYKSFFVYGKLNGPLVTLEFATISGVRVGFGFNSLVRLPSAEGLYQFPFISDSAAAGGDDPLKILNLMMQGEKPFVYKKEGGGWFCAGMTITCFDCITLTAVLMFEVETKSDQNGVIIALLADGVFQMPPLVDENIALFYIELLIKVELNFIEGFIAADAALAPASHVYVPWAHLTGSGSFYTWFAPSSHAGDWVVSIGGYHRAYTPPDHYPQRLTRLGLSFVVGNNIHVVGGAYVAVTPKCAMAGGSLHISLEVGPVSASADIALDVFINFKPFYFIAEIRLSVSIECDVDLKLVSFHVSISLGADLVMWGPESFGGRARVHFWFFGFDIDFGAGLRDPPGISLLEFDEIIRTPGPDSNPPPDDKTSEANPFQARHKYSIEDGLFPNKPKSNDGEFPDTGANSEWKVLAGSLQLRIDSDFSLSSASIVTKIEQKPKPVPHEGDSTAVVPPVDPEEDKKWPKITRESIFTVPKKELKPIYAFPMHNTVPITSDMEIIVYFLEGTEENKQIIPDFQCELVLKEAPRAMWDKYTSDSDPLSRISGGKRNKPRTLEAGENPTVELCQGVRLKAPEPVLSRSPIVDFDATSAMQQIIPPGLPPIVPAGTSLLTFDASQDVYLAEEFEPNAEPATQWKDFGELWNGTTSPQTTDEAGNKIDKSEIRKTILGVPGALGLLADTLGWNHRRPAEMKGGKVPITTNHDGTTQRMEWELVGDTPVILSDELDYYYPALPMVCGVA